MRPFGSNVTRLRDTVFVIPSSSIVPFRAWRTVLCRDRWTLEIICSGHRPMQLALAVCPRRRTSGIEAWSGPNLAVVVLIVPFSGGILPDVRSGAFCIRRFKKRILAYLVSWGLLAGTGRSVAWPSKGDVGAFYRTGLKGPVFSSDLPACCMHMSVPVCSGPSWSDS